MKNDIKDERGLNLLSRNVIYEGYDERPRKGKVNVYRKYQVDFSAASTAMGTYYFLDV